MKGKTHLAIGTAIGILASAYYPFTVKSAGLYIAVSAFSALSADLDGQSILSSKLGKLSKILHDIMLWAGILLAAAAAFVYAQRQIFYPELTTAAVIALLLGFIAREGMIRNFLVSVIGGCLIYAGWISKMNWLMGFGLFVGWAPWLRHRGMTHTVWAILLWGAIGAGLEEQLHMEGIMALSMLGYCSHLVADTITPSGVKWFYPLYKKPIKLPL